MNDEQTHQQLVQVAELMEIIDKLTAKAQLIGNTPIQMVGPDVWADVQEHVAISNALLTSLREILPKSSRAIGNDLLQAHLNAVIYASD